MYLEKNSEKKWLIKSEYNILGPYSFDQIVDLIRKGQISLIDEIRDPEKRWCYVREKSEFKDIVEEMRVQINSAQESTMTYQSLFKPAEDTVSKTEGDGNPFTDINFEAKDVSIVSEIIQNNEKKPILPKEPVKVYGVQTDAQVQSKVSIFSNKLLLTSIAGLLAVGLLVYGYIYIQKRNMQKQEEEIVLQIKKLKYLGLSAKAADLYAKLPVIQQKKLIPEVLDLFPELESVGLLQFSDIQQLKDSTNFTTEQKANFELVQFWVSMQNKSYEDARAHLIKATSLAPDLAIIKENEALVLLKKGQYKEAFELYKQLNQNEKNGRLLFGLSIGYSQLSDLEKNQTAGELLKVLDNYTAVYYDYKKELLLAQILLAHQTQNDVLYQVSLKQYLSTPVLLSHQFKKPALLAPSSYNWQDLSGIKDSVSKLLTGDESILFQLHDLLEMNQLSQASEFVNISAAKMADPQQKEQLYLLLYNAQGRSREVLSLEKAEKLNMNSELNQLLITQNKLLEDPNADISAHLTYFQTKQLLFYKDWMELQALIRKNATNELKTFVKERFVTTPNFNPVFEAKGLIN